MTLECDSVLLDFGFNRVLSDVYIKCRVGEFVGLLGRNGSGKSCLMRTIFGTLRPESASVRIDGFSVQHSLYGKTVAYRPQHHFIPSSVRIRKAFHLYGTDISLVEEFFGDMEQHLDKYPGELSGGALKILEVVLVLGCPAPFVVLDEPFSGIMPIHTEQVKMLMTKLKSAKGILITDHMYRHILDVSDRLYVLTNGKTWPITQRDQLVHHGYV